MAGLKSLEYLNLSNNSIRDISPLFELNSLEHLDLSLNKISDVHPIANLVSLKTLYLKYNPIIDFSPLVSIYENLNDCDFDISSESNINLSGISIGDSKENVIALFGNPSRIDHIEAYIKEYDNGYYDLFGTQIIINSDNSYIDDEDKKDSIVYSHEVKGQISSTLDILNTEKVELIFFNDIYNFNLSVVDIPEEIDFSGINGWEIVITDGEHKYRYICTPWIPEGMPEILPYDIAGEEFLSNMGVYYIDEDGQEYAIGHNGTAEIEFDKNNGIVRIKGITPDLLDPNNIESIKLVISYTEGYSFKEFEEIIK